MASSKTSKANIKESILPPAPKIRPFWAAFFLLFGLCIFVVLLDWSPLQSTESHPMTGRIGRTIGEWLFGWFGLSAWLISIFSTWMGLAFCLRTTWTRWSKLLWMVLITVSISGLLTWIKPGKDDYLPRGIGGVLGELLNHKAIEQFIGPVGIFIVLVVILVTSSIFLLTVDVIIKAYHKWREHRLIRAAAAAEKKRQAEEEALLAKNSEPATEENKKKSRTSTKPEDLLSDEEKYGAKKNIKAIESLPAIPKEKEDKPGKIADATARKNATVDEKSLRIISNQQVERGNIKPQKKHGDYVFPPADLLSEPQAPATDSTEDHAERAQSLLRTLAQFDIKVELGDIHTGPVITRYDISPAPGVRTNRILSLESDIAMGMHAQGVRVLMVPEKGCMGVEVPNRIKSPVVLREILESRIWGEIKADIPLALGKEVSGKPVVLDLAKMPHLLIAGSTGSGKSVCINAIITSLLYRCSPEELRFIMVDPKVVEMQMYNVLPHMLIPVVTDPKKVPGALKWLINEMERRYHLFAEKKVRNISGYNALIEKGVVEENDEEADDDQTIHDDNMNIEVPRDLETGMEEEKKLPYIVCIIDEFADLMAVNPAEVELGVQRLAAKARAAGIHLILATQRPNVKVITGNLKNNLPSRIAFKVTSGIDSRTILDEYGAERLIGRGDMLFVPPGTSEPTRAQCAFVSDEEVQAIVDFLHERNGGPQINQAVQEHMDAAAEPDGTGGNMEAGDWDDPLIPQAIEIIRTSKKASISFLQRRMKIGYNRAARIMDLLEEEGIVSPDNGQGREILDPDN